MEKKDYLLPEFELIELFVEDVITGSPSDVEGDLNSDDDYGDEENPQ